MKGKELKPASIMKSTVKRRAFGRLLNFKTEEPQSCLNVKC